MGVLGELEKVEHVRVLGGRRCLISIGRLQRGREVRQRQALALMQSEGDLALEVTDRQRFSTAFAAYQTYWSRSRRSGRAGSDEPSTRFVPSPMALS